MWHYYPLGFWRFLLFLDTWKVNFYQQWTHSINTPIPLILFLVLAGNHTIIILWFTLLKNLVNILGDIKNASDVNNELPFPYLCKPSQKSSQLYMLASSLTQYLCLTEADMLSLNKIWPTYGLWINLFMTFIGEHRLQEGSLPEHLLCSNSSSLFVTLEQRWS